ncbi:MAG: hypothetical protein ABIP03_03820 [Aquihabitans sp.]
MVLVVWLARRAPNFFEDSMTNENTICRAPTGELSVNLVRIAHT